MFSFSVSTNSLRGSCRTKGVHWDGVLVSPRYSSNRASPTEVVVGGYKYFVDVSSAKQFDSGECIGGDPGSVFYRGVCRIEVE